METRIYMHTHTNTLAYTYHETLILYNFGIVNIYNRPTHFLDPSVTRVLTYLSVSAAEQMTNFSYSATAISCVLQAYIWSYSFAYIIVGYCN